MTPISTASFGPASAWETRTVCAAKAPKIDIQTLLRIRLVSAVESAQPVHGMHIADT